MFKENVTNNIPSGRYGTNEEMANLALFLGSNESSFCNGGVYLADGGFTASKKGSLGAFFALHIY